MLRSTLIVTLFVIAGQAVNFLVFAVAAALFGAGSAMDAYLAAVTLPQYVTAVVVNALGFVFIPVFVQYRAEGDEARAWEVASGVISMCLAGLAAVTLAGVLLADTLLRMTAPGLEAPVRRLAVSAALVTWPMILGNGAFSLLAGVYQASGRFSWPAAAPVLGGLVTLGLLPVLVPGLGVLGLAIGTTVGALVQAAVLLPMPRGRLRLGSNWTHPGVREVFRLLVPLVLSGVIVRWTPIIERFLASGLGEGAIARLGYAFMLVTVLSKLLSTGITTVIFPRMALDASGADRVGLGRRLSLGLRTMWLPVAPAMAICLALGPAVVAVAFGRGEFSVGDVERVASLFSVYVLALFGMCLGNVTARVFYVLRDTRRLAVIGVVEALAYAGYATLLAAAFGAKGIAWAYVIYFNLSIVLHLVVLRARVGRVLNRKLATSFARTVGAAAIAGMVAWGVSTLTGTALLELLVAGTVGVVAYVSGLWVTGSRELTLVWAPVSARLRSLLRPAS